MNEICCEIDRKPSRKMYRVNVPTNVFWLGRFSIRAIGKKRR